MSGLEYNNKLYAVVCNYLQSHGNIDYSKFKLSNDGNVDSVSYISTWAYGNITQPSQSDLQVILPSIGNVPAINTQYAKLQEIVGLPDLTQSNSVFIYQGNVCAIVNGQLLVAMARPTI